MRDLTAREIQVLRMICDPSLLDTSNKAIASAMGLTEGSVKTYAARLYHKLRVSNRRGAILWGLQNGFGKLEVAADAE